MAPAFGTEGVWLVTGSSSGLGQAIVQHVHKAGHNIVATARNVESLKYLPDGPKVLKLQLDVTSSESITASIKAAVEKFGRLDVVINNAGYNVISELEGFPEDTAHKMLDTMFWAPVQMTRESLRIFREVNPPGLGGTVIQVSSVGGVIAVQGNAFYHASKHALEGFSKAVRKELLPEWNINIVILSPGAVNTKFQSSVKFLPIHPAYDVPEAPTKQIVEFMKSPALAGISADADKCAAVLFDAVIGQKERPLPVRLNLGADADAWNRNDVDMNLKEMKEWEKETFKVSPPAALQSTKAL